MKVALLLGTDGYAALTVNQADRLSGGLIEAAENWIDAYTGRSWLDGSPVVGERRPIEDGRVWLTHRPITAVSAVRFGGLFDTADTLTVTTDYVVDATRGCISLLSYRRGEVAVDYTYPQTVPADVAEAAGLIVAGWLQDDQAGVGAAGTYKSITTDGQQLVYRDQATLGEIPLAAEKLLKRYRQVLV